MNRMERGRYETTYDIKRKWRQMMEDRFACAWPHADRWFSVDEIADHLVIKRDTIYRWISKRNMPGHKIGRLWKFKQKEVDEWVTSGGANVSQRDNENPKTRKRES